MNKLPPIAYVDSWAEFQNMAATVGAMSQKERDAVQEAFRKFEIEISTEEFDEKHR